MYGLCIAVRRCSVVRTTILSPLAFTELRIIFTLLLVSMTPTGLLESMHEKLEKLRGDHFDVGASA